MELDIHIMNFTHNREKFDGYEMFEEQFDESI